MSKIKSLFSDQFDVDRIVNAVFKFILQKALVSFTIGIVIVGLSLMILVFMFPVVAVEALIENELLMICYSDPFSCSGSGQEKLRNNFSAYPGE